MVSEVHDKSSTDIISWCQKSVDDPETTDIISWCQKVCDPVYRHHFMVSEVLDDLELYFKRN